MQILLTNNSYQLHQIQPKAKAPKTANGLSTYEAVCGLVRSESIRRTKGLRKSPGLNLRPQERVLNRTGMSASVGFKLARTLFR